MEKPYSRIRPSFVVLWNYQNADGDIKPLIFATKTSAKDFWQAKTSRATDEAEIRRYVPNTKSQMIDAIQQILVGEQKMDIEEYTKALKSHDWFYDFSDAYDSPRWTNGHKRHIQLERAAMDLDPDYKIWNEHAPDMYQKGR